MQANHFRNHIFSILFVGLVFAIVFYQAGVNNSVNQENTDSEQFAALKSLNFDKTLDRLLFKDIYNIYYPQNSIKTDSLINQIQNFRRQQEVHFQTQNQLDITFKELLKMIIQFILVYLAVLFLTYYAVHAFGLYRFIREKQGRGSYLFLLYQRWSQKDTQKRLRKLADIFILSIKALLKGLIYFILYAPAYVIAYSIKTRFDTNSLIFMIGLGTVSNAFLITYIQKFYTFLVAESRKGYVESAVVKNLKRSFSSISLKEIFSIRRSFPDHILEQIYENARYQYFSSVKEQASFLITGLIIIEMALNIQNHLCYTLLQTILYQEYRLTLIIVFVIFLIVKVTEIVIDSRLHRLAQLYDNRPEKRIDSG